MVSNLHETIKGFQDYNKKYPKIWITKEELELEIGETVSKEHLMLLLNLGYIKTTKSLSDPSTRYFRYVGMNKKE